MLMQVIWKKERHPTIGYWVGDCDITQQKSLQSRLYTGANEEKCGGGSLQEQSLLHIEN